MQNVAQRLWLVAPYLAFFLLLGSISVVVRLLVRMLIAVWQ